MSPSPAIAASIAIEQEIIDQFLARQDNQEEFVRTVSDELESVGYLPDSNMRFWYNNTMLSYKQHCHTAVEMIVPVEGNYQVTVSQQVYELRPGDIFVIPSGEIHELNAPSRGGRFIFLFEFNLIRDIKGFSYFAASISKPVLINRSTCPSIYNEEMALVRQMCQDYLRGDSLKEVAVYSRLLTFFLNYSRCRLSLEGGYAPSQLYQTAQKNHAERFNAVFTYLDRHFAEDLTLEHVAAVAGFSKFHFSRTFKQLSGFNFNDYLCRRRVKAAEVLLVKPGLSVSQIALQSGFSSVSTFNRTFKKLKGCTPTQYRGMFQVNSELSYYRGETENERETD